MQAVQTDPRAESAGTDDPDRWFGRRLAFLVAIAAVWRLGALAFDKWHQPLMLNDSLYYSAQAQQLADGVWFREIFVDRPGAEHGPLTSTVLAAVSWVDDPVPWQRLVTVLFGIATVAFVGLLGRRLAGRRRGPAVGLVAAGLAAVYPNLWMNDGLVMSESVSVLMVTLVLFTGLGLLARRSSRTAAFVGVLAGLAALARSELALLTPAIMVLLVVLGRRSGDPASDGPASGGPASGGPRGPRRPWGRALVPALVLGVASLATVAPWVVFNLSRFEETVTLTTNEGTTLLGSYCDATFSGPELGGWSIFCVTSDPAYSMDEEPSVRSVRQREMAVAYAREHLRELPRVVVARVARTLDLSGLDSLVAQDVGEERWRWASWAGIVSWWVLAPLAVAGGVHRWRDTRVDRTGRAGLWLLLVPVVSVFVVTVVFYGAHRIRSSLEPTVVVLAAVAVVAIVDRRRAAGQAGSAGPAT